MGMQTRRRRQPVAIPASDAAEKAAQAKDSKCINEWQKGLEKPQEKQEEEAQAAQSGQEAEVDPAQPKKKARKSKAKKAKEPQEESRCPNNTMRMPLAQGRIRSLCICMTESWGTFIHA